MKYKMEQENDLERRRQELNDLAMLAVSKTAEMTFSTKVCFLELIPFPKMGLFQLNPSLSFRASAKRVLTVREREVRMMMVTATAKGS